MRFSFLDSLQPEKWDEQARAWRYPLARIPELNVISLEIDGATVPPHRYQLDKHAGLIRWIEGDQPQNVTLAARYQPWNLLFIRKLWLPVLALMMLVGSLLFLFGRLSAPTEAGADPAAISALEMQLKEAQSQHDSLQQQLQDSITYFQQLALDADDTGLVDTVQNLRKKLRQQEDKLEEATEDQAQYEHRLNIANAQLRTAREELQQEKNKPAPSWTPPYRGYKARIYCSLERWQSEICGSDFFGKLYQHGFLVSHREVGSASSKGKVYYGSDGKGQSAAEFARKTFQALTQSTELSNQIGTERIINIFLD